MGWVCRFCDAPTQRANGKARNQTMRRQKKWHQNTGTKVAGIFLRRAWDAEHALPIGASEARKRNTWTKRSGQTVDQVRQWFIASVAPLVAKSSIAEIRGATGLSARYVIVIRQGHAPHPTTL